MENFDETERESWTQRRYVASQQLDILALGPYPALPHGRGTPGQSEHRVASWTGGPALIPAAQLAASLINSDSSILNGYYLNIVPVDSGV